MTSGRLSLRLTVPATLYWSFVPLVEIAGLAVVWRRKREPIPFSLAIDLFFRSNAPYLLWVIGFAAIWAFVPTVRVNRWFATTGPWLHSAYVAAFCSACLDLRFFRSVLGRGWAGAVASLLTQRAVTWGLGLAWFVGMGGWQVVSTRFGW